MRKIELEMVRAVDSALADRELAGQVWRSANTSVRQDHNGPWGVPGYSRVVDVILHQTTVARFEPDLQRLTLRTNGWHSRTTASRINALLGWYAPHWRVFSERGRLRIRRDSWSHGLSDPLIEGYLLTFHG